ncbi:MAG: hypothetical protein IKS25_02415, partial [Oscillospiraceae bacterium]|nr:hypothetical protein [Oscillospiraceae bacterium]
AGRLTLNCGNEDECVKIENARVKIENTGIIDCGWTLKNSTVEVKGGRAETLAPISLSVDSSTILLDGGELEEAKLEGDNTLIYTGDSRLKDLTFAGNASLTVAATATYGTEGVLSVTGALSSPSTATIVVNSGVLAFAETCTDSGVVVTNRKPISGWDAAGYQIPTDSEGNATSASVIRDASGKVSISANDTAAVGVRMPGASEIPAEKTYYYDFRDDEINHSIESYYTGSNAFENYRLKDGETTLSYQSLRDAYYGNVGTDYGHIFLLEKADGSRVMLSPRSTGPVDASDVIRIREIQRSPDPPGASGSTASSTSTVYTGNGNLGQSAGSISGGGNAKLFSGSGISHPIRQNNPSGDENNTGTGGENNGEATVGGERDQQRQDAQLWVEEEKPGERYVLRASEGEKTLAELGGRATVSMRYTPPADSTGKTYYVVFRDSDGTLRAFRASYSRLKGELRFETDMLGEFTVVAFDFDGEEFSDAFYEALEEYLKTKN